LVLQIQELVKGDGTPTRPGHDNVVIQLNALTTQLGEITQRIDEVENTASPVLLKADEELKKLQVQAEGVHQKMSSQPKDQEKKHDDLIEHTADKFQECENTANGRHADLISNARGKFDEMEQAQQDMFTGATNRFDELEQFRLNFENQVATKMSETVQQMVKVDTVYKALIELGQADVREVRATLAERFGSTGRDHSVTRGRKEISEYKAISSLARYTGDSRLGYKTWTRKLKNALDQVRGREWREALTAMETHRVSEDFEELASHDDQWDDWFRDNHGEGRTDGGTVVDLDQFKSDLMWLLTDKLDDSLVELIQKHAPNGLRAYKKLWIWSQDISMQARQAGILSIMNPTRAASDETLADRIESWDREQIESLKVDSSCELRAPFILNAFKQLLPEKVLKHIDEQMDQTVSNNYEKLSLLRQKVYGWALKKRLEQREKGKSKSNDVNNVNPDIPSDLPDTQSPNIPNAYWGGGQEGWYDEWGNWMDAMGKGKGSAKGGPKGGGKKGGPGGKGQFNGYCNNCGKWGHKAANCRVPVGFNAGKNGKGKGGQGGGKGKGKYGKGLNMMEGQDWNTYQPHSHSDNPVNALQGKGNPNIQCYNCWEWGHIARDCPHKGKGAGGQAPVNSVEAHPGKGPGPGPGSGTQQPREQTPQGPATTARPGFCGSLDFGGKSDDYEQPKVRDLRTMFEEAGWSVRGKKGKNAMPNMSTILDCLMLEENPVPEEVIHPPRCRSAMGGTRCMHMSHPRVPDFCNSCDDNGQHATCECDCLACLGMCPQQFSVKQSKPLDAIDSDTKEWKELKITVDSGACDHVMNPNLVDTS
jgi:hypothetical protein